MSESEGPILSDLPVTIYQSRSIASAKARAGLVDLARAGLAGRMEADVWLERAVALDRMCTLLGMRLCALELCSVY